jgi:hypothetical protein
MELLSLFIGASIGGVSVYFYKCQCDFDRTANSVRVGTQAYRLRIMLEKGMYITNKFADDELGIKSLTSVVDKLRKAGVDVKHVESNYGNYYKL